MRHEIEIVFTVALAAIASVLAALHGLALVAPTAEGAAFVGVHYVVPAFAALIWGVCLTHGDAARTWVSAVVAIVCYVVVVWLHFNVKLWAPFINPAEHDVFYRRTDDAIRPVIDAAFALRRALAGVVPGIDALYMHGFIALFYVSFCVHALRSPEHFRKVFLAALFLQGLGALAYLVTPCVGPFALEPGLNMLASQAQAAMVEARGQMLTIAPGELDTRAAGALFSGLAAMPSLHAGGAFLFVWFAARWEPYLLVAYVPIFLFILVEAVASRWHYVIDLPIGIALAALSIHLAFRLDRPRAPRPQALVPVPGFEPA